VSDQKSGNAAPQPSGETITIKRHGEEIVLPIDKVRDLAAKGFDYETKMGALKSERSALEGDTVRFREYQSFYAQVQADPVLGQAIQKAIANPSAVVNGYAGTDSYSDDDDDYAPSKNEAALRREIEELKSGIHRVTADLRNSKAIAAAEQSQKRLESEISSYPWLKDGEVASLAREYAEGELARNPSETVEAAVARAATKFRDILEKKQGVRVAQIDSKQEFRTESPTNGSPSAEVPQKYTPSDLANGTVLDNALKKLKEWQGRVTQAD
jgi:hypothetical protein